MRRRMLVTMVVMISSGMLAQNSTIYLQAADINDKQANACGNPAGAACYHQMASYNRCLARQLGPGGATCPAAPTCTPSCGSVSSTKNSTPNVLGTDTGSTGSVKGDIAMAGLKGLIQWKLNHDAQKDAQQQTTGTGDNAGRDDDVASQAQREADEAALVAAQATAAQQKLNNQAADILQQSNALLASNDAASGVPQPKSHGSSTAAIDALLDSGAPAPNSAAAVNALLSNSGSDDSPSRKTANAVAGLLDDNSKQTQSSSQAHWINSLAQTQAAMQPSIGSVYAGAYSDQEDSPQAEQAGVTQYLSNLVHNPSQVLNDGLDRVTSLENQAINAYHNALNDPSVQFVMTMHRLYTDGNIGAPTASDTPDQQANKVFVPAMMIPAMALKNGGTSSAQRDALKSGATTAGENVTIMMGLAMPEPESQQ